MLIPSPQWFSTRRPAGKKARRRDSLLPFEGDFSISCPVPSLSGSITVLCPAGIIQHELMHVLGFTHEHTRKDRDRYIKINYENIMPGVRRNFQIFPDGLLCSQYDYCSVMHYPSPAFSVSATVHSPQSSVSSPPQYFIEESETNYRGTGASSRVLAGTEGRFVRDGYKEGEQSVRLQGIPAGPA